MNAFQYIVHRKSDDSKDIEPPLCEIWFFMRLTHVIS